MKKRFVSRISMIIKARDGLMIKISPQEINCLKLLSKGYTAKQIADTLNISPRTSENHIYHIKGKTGYNLRSDLISLYLNQIKE